MQETKAGLLVPDGTVERDRMVIPKDDAKQIRRAAKIFKQAGLTMGVFCVRCQTPVETEADAAGNLTFTCKCLLRVLEGLRP